MAKKGDPRVDRHVVTYLRSEANMTQAEFGDASGVDQSDVSRYELGKDAPPEKSLRRMAKVPDVPWPLVVHLRRFHTALAAAKDRWRTGTDDAGTPRLEPALLNAVLLAVAPCLVETGPVEPPAKTLDEERREAEEVWAALERFPMPRRRRLIELAPRASLTHALAERAHQASVSAASENAAETQGLAELAQLIAEQVPGE